MTTKCASCNSGIGVMMSSIATEPLCYECWKWVWDLGVGSEVREITMANPMDVDKIWKNRMKHEDAMNCAWEACGMKYTRSSEPGCLGKVDFGGVVKYDAKKFWDSMHSMKHDHTEFTRCSCGISS